MCSNSRCVCVCVFVLLWLCYSKTFVPIDTVLIISITNYHQSSRFSLSYLILSVDAVLLGWTWLQNKEQPGSHLIYAWGYWWTTNESTQYTLLYRFFCFWSSVACWVVILTGCGGCLGGLLVQCSLPSKLHVFLMPDKTSEMGLPHSWHFTCFHMLYLICHVHSLIINEVMEIYSCIELTPSTKLMSCEGWGYFLSVTYITTGLYWQCNINVL